MVSSDLTFWLLSHSWLCVAMKISGKQGSERHFLLTFIIRSPEARSFWQPSGMFILLELGSWGLMTVSFLVRFSKFRPCFSQICSCSSFLFKVFFSDCSAIPLAFLGHLNTYKNMSHSVIFDWSSPSHPPLEPMVLFIPFWCWCHGLHDFFCKQRTIGLLFSYVNITLYVKKIAHCSLQFSR